MTAATERCWQTLADRNLVDGPAPPESRAESPWYVRLMLGIAGWIAALFLLGFIAVGLAWVIRSEPVSTIAGLSFMSVAWLMLRKISGNDFAVQFALALSFAGQVLYAVGIFGWLGLERDDSSSWLVMAMTQSLLSVLMPNSIHRLWSAAAASVAFYMLMYSLHLAFVSPGIILCVAAWAWLHEFDWPGRSAALRPIAFGLLLGLIAMDTATGTIQPLTGLGVDLTAGDLAPRWATALLSGAVMVVVVWTLLRRWQLRVPGKMANYALSAAFFLALLSLKVPGLSVGVCIMLLGYAHGNRVLTGLGIGALLLYLSTYYYSLSETLLVKSQALAIWGAALLSLRWLLQRWLWRDGKGDDA